MNGIARFFVGYAVSWSVSYSPPSQRKRIPAYPARRVEHIPPTGAPPGGGGARRAPARAHDTHARARNERVFSGLRCREMYESHSTKYGPRERGSDLVACVTPPGPQRFGGKFLFRQPAG